MVADNIHRRSPIPNDDLPEGVERIGDLAIRYIQQHPMAPAERLDTKGGAHLAPPAATETYPPTARNSSACPHCVGERSRFYRPGIDHDHQQITSPEEAAEILVPILQGLDREHCVSLNLDTRHRLVGATTVSIGSIDHTFMSPREIFRDALMHGAAAIVVAHNHPSGDPDPSRDDELVTRRLHNAGEIVGVDVLDHMVVGHDRWVSLARRGALTERSRSPEGDGIRARVR